MDDSIASGLHDHSIAYLNKYKKEFCKIANHTNVPPALLAGVVITEAELNRSVLDRIQDAMLIRMLQSKDATWWDQWQQQGERLAKKSIPFRMLSNKWPVELWHTGYVQTFGSAQVSPRTAILACKNLINKYDVCRIGVKGIVEKISKDPDGILIAGIVLDSEREQYQRVLNIDVSNSIAKWATIYNVGSDFVIMSHSNGYKLKANRFGKHVLNNYAYIDQLLNCKFMVNPCVNEVTP